MSEENSRSTPSTREGSPTKAPKVSAATVDAIIGHITKPASPPMDPYAPSAPQTESRPSVSVGTGSPSQASTAEPDSSRSIYPTTPTKQLESYPGGVSETVADRTTLNKTPVRITDGDDDITTADQSISNPPASPADSLFDGSPTNFKIKYSDVTEPTAEDDAEAGGDGGDAIEKRPASKSPEGLKDVKKAKEDANENKNKELKDRWCKG